LKIAKVFIFLIFLVDNYFISARKIWPYKMYRIVSEEVLLELLALENYNVDDALNKIQTINIKFIDIVDKILNFIDEPKQSNFKYCFAHGACSNRRIRVKKEKK
jgi:hypothetical protein